MNRAFRKIRTGLLLAAILTGIALTFFFINGKTDSPGIPSVLPERAGSVSADAKFEEFLTDIFRQEASASALSLHYILENPETYGISHYTASLGTYSEENIRDSAVMAENLLHTLHAFDANHLQTKNQITYEVLEDSLENARMAASFSFYEEPLRVSTGEQAELPILLAEYAFHSARDITDYLDILDSVPSYLSGICDYERKKAEKGLFMPDFAAATIISQCREFAASGENNYLIYTFEEKTDALKGLSQNEAAGCKQQNRAIVLNRVLPAFQEIAGTLEDILKTAHSGSDSSLQNSGPDGLCTLPNGREYYQFLVRQYTGSSDSVDTLKKRTEEKRKADLQRAARLLSSSPGLEQTMLQAAPACAAPEEMLAALKKEIRKDFPEIPDCSYTLKHVDASMADYMAPAFYLTSPLDHCTENTIYINPKNDSGGLHLFTTLAHEGFPGHLYQNAVFSSTHPSPVRALLGYPGYIEGWATYAEMLSYRYAGIPSGAAEALSLEQSAILSLYATADMGIHYDGWSFQDTLQFFSSYGFADETAVREIYELICEEPAHYLKYYIGYLEFTDLKETAKKTGGETYSDLEFHRTVLLIGPAPFSILKKYYFVILRMIPKNMGITTSVAASQASGSAWTTPGNPFFGITASDMIPLAASSLSPASIARLLYPRP